MSITEQINAMRAAAEAEIEAFLVKAGISAAEFGELAMGDRRFVYDVRKGRKMEPETIDVVRMFMGAYKVPKRGKPKPGNAPAHRAA